MKVQYDIAVEPVEIPLSNNRLMVQYVYVFPDCVNVEKEIGKIKRKRRPGWKQYDADSVVHRGTLTHLWINTVYYKRERPEKRIKH